MKPPVIRIKKGSVIYDDAGAQQQSEPFRPDLTPARGRRPVRRRRIGPQASLFPLLIIAAAIFLLFRVLPHARTTRGDVAGWQAALHVTPYEGTLIVGVTFVSRSGSLVTDPPEAAVAISLPGTDEQASVTGSLDRSPITLSGRLPAVAGAGRVRAEVAIRGSRIVLSAPVPKPLH